jgi:hypothetical protein
VAYELAGVQYPSVTSILSQMEKPALISWASNCAVDHIAENIKTIQNPSGPHVVDHVLRDARQAFRHAGDKAKGIGTMVHDAIEQYVKGGKDAIGEVPTEVENSLLAFYDWEAKNHVVWEESELTLFNTKDGYCGTCDAVATVNGVRYLVDFKTSKAVYDEYRLQLAAYREAYNLMFPDKYLEHVAVLRLDKATGEPEWRDLDSNLLHNLRTFKVLTTLYYVQKKRRLKNNPWVELYW